MRKEDITWVAMLMEAVSLVSAIIDIGLQIYCGVSYGATPMNIAMNLVMLIVIYAGFTMLSIYPEWVNHLHRGVCSGDVRKYTLRMVRISKMIIVAGLLLASISDVMGKALPAWCTIAVAICMIATIVYYEYKIIRILRERYKR